MEDPKFLEWGKRYIAEHPDFAKMDVGEQAVQGAKMFASEAWNESRKQAMQDIEDAKKQEQEKFKAALKGMKMPGLLKDQIQDAFNHFK